MCVILILLGAVHLYRPTGADLAHMVGWGQRNKKCVLSMVGNLGGSRKRGSHSRQSYNHVI